MIPLAGLGLLAALALPTTTPDDSQRRPIVVLIGDSIRMGYAPFVAERLQGKATVISPEENGGDTSNVLKHLDEWAVATRPVVIHFNAGLHDLKLDRQTGRHQVELDAYRSNLQMIRQDLENRTAARLIFATTTPVDDERHHKNKPFDRELPTFAPTTASPWRCSIRRLSRSTTSTPSSPPGSIRRPPSSPTASTSPRPPTRPSPRRSPRRSRPPSTSPRPPARPFADGPTSRRRSMASSTTRSGSHAAVIDKFPSFWAGKASTGSTKARLLWDDQALYFAAEMTDAEMRAFGAKHNDMLWNGDVFELFFKPDTEKPAYYEFQVNPRSVVLELAFPRRGFDFATLAAKPPMGFRAVAKVDGTLDAPGDRDRGWTVEGRIPWSIFAPSGGAAQARRHLDLRPLPLRLRPRRHRACPHQLRPAPSDELPPLRGLRQAHVREGGEVKRLRRYP